MFIGIGIGLYSSGLATETIDMSATGGLEFRDGDYVYHKFIISGDFIVTTGGMLSEFLLVGGGGGGGGSGSSTYGGGGGAGEAINSFNQPIIAGTFPITVGVGGSYQVSGENSTFNALTAIGGGGGGDRNTAPKLGSSGGGGGGADHYPAYRIGAAGTEGQGYAGGNAEFSGEAGTYRRIQGGGGGASEAGTTATTTQAGDGGNGIQSSITGTATYYAGGGGGSTYDQNNVVTSGGLGGLGGGANGTIGSTVASSASPSTGSGGGGGTDAVGSSGGSGVVILRYKNPTKVIAFNPVQVPGIAGWWDSSQSEGITLRTAGEFDYVTQILDLSGNGRDLTQPYTSYQPTYVLSAKNGLNVIRTFAPYQNLFLSNTDIIKNAPYCYIFCVFKYSSTVGNSYYIFNAYGINTGTNRAISYVDKADTKFTSYSQRIDGGTIGDLKNTDALNTSNYYISCSAFLWNDAILNNYLNSPTILKTLNPFLTAGNCSDTNCASIALGDSTGVYSMLGDYCETIVYTPSSALTDQNIIDIYSYLNTKWVVYA